MNICGHETKSDLDIMHFRYKIVFCHIPMLSMIFGHNGCSELRWVYRSPDKNEDNLSTIDFGFSSLWTRPFHLYQAGSKEFTSLEHCLCGVGVCVSVCSEHGSSGPVCLWWGYHPDHRDMQQDDGTNATSPPVSLLTRRHFTRRDFSLSVDTNTR